MMKVGDKVRVIVSNPEEWAYGAAEGMGGLTGVIEEVKATHNNGREIIPQPGGTLYLVRFDPHDRPHWNSYKPPMSGFHFTASDLELL